jgi:hypothetical protein
LAKDDHASGLGILANDADAGAIIFQKSLAVSKEILKPSV